MSTQDKLSRREFMRVAGLATAGVAAVACQPQTVIVERTVEVETVIERTVEVEKIVEQTVQVQKEVTKVIEKVIEVTAVPAEIKESPATFGKVSAGQLPPVDERLPADPMVTLKGNGFEQEVGTYGGVIQLLGENLPPDRAYLLRLDRFCTGTEPHVAKGWEFAEDGKSCTLFLRRGMRWSDGEPFTADDILFWWENFQLNEDLNTAPSSWWVHGGTPMTVEKTDDYTVQYTFALPFWMFIHQLDATGYRGSQSDANAYSCAHHAQQFHPDFTSSAEADAKAAGYDDWMSYYRYETNGVKPGTPMLTTWTKDDETPTGDYGERNAYSFKIDAEGNQLPYIDAYNRSRRGDPETRVLQITAGQVDFEAWGLTVTQFPVLKASEEAGGYDVWMGVDLWTAATQLAFNHCYEEDMELGDLLRNVQFRRALSVAIDRDEINEVIFMGYGRPVQMTVTPDSKWYKEEWAQAYAQYDPDQANAWLDEIGLDKRDAEGFRLMPSGAPLNLVVDVANNIGFWIPTTEIVKEQWEAVGIRTIINVVEGGLLWEREGGNQQQVWVWVRDAMSQFIINGRPDQNWWWAQQWSNWWRSRNQDEPSGIEPPDDVKPLYEAQEGWLHFDEDQVFEAVQVIFDDQAENIRCIGTGAPGGQPCITNKKLGNVDREAHADSYDTGGTQNNWLETFFWKA